MTSSEQRPRLVPGQNCSIETEIYDQKSTERLTSDDDDDFQIEVEKKIR